MIETRVFDRDERKSGKRVSGQARSWRVPGLYTREGCLACPGVILHVLLRSGPCSPTRDGY